MDVLGHVLFTRNVGRIGVYIDGVHLFYFMGLLQDFADDIRLVCVLENLAENVS